MKIPRSKFATYLNVGTKALPEYARCGDGITEQTISYNAQTEEEQYIHQDSASSDITSYKPTVNSPMTAVTGDPVFEFVDDIRIRRAVLDDATTDLIFVYAYKDEVSGALVAERNACSIQIDDFGGAAGESVKLNFTINLKGDAVPGTFLPNGTGGGSFTETA